ncbi:TPA: hypothetical protein DIC62_01625 [Candidatus Nomurabacteria bacterium]|nr:hypothetical protein [Candidatus Nomurabacteria bacterium]
MKINTICVITKYLMYEEEEIVMIETNKEVAEKSYEQLQQECKFKYSLKTFTVGEEPTFIRR